MSEGNIINHGRRNIFPPQTLVEVFIKLYKPVVLLDVGVNDRCDCFPFFALKLFSLETVLSAKTPLLILNLLVIQEIKHPLDCTPSSIPCCCGCL